MKNYFVLKALEIYIFDIHDSPILFINRLGRGIVKWYDVKI